MKLSLCVSALALVLSLLCGGASGAGHVCPPQVVPFDTSLLGRTFIKLQSCPSNSSTARTLFQVFERVLVFIPMHTPMEGTCPTRVVFHLRRSPALPFVVKLPELMVNDSATCAAQQMAMRSRYFLNGRTREEFIHATEKMVDALKMMRMGACPTEMDNMMMMMMMDDDAKDMDMGMDTGMGNGTADMDMGMDTGMGNGTADMDMGMDTGMGNGTADMDMDMASESDDGTMDVMVRDGHLDMGMMEAGDMGGMDMMTMTEETAEPSEVAETPEATMEAVVFPELDSLISFFLGVAYTNNYCIE